MSDLDQNKFFRSYSLDNAALTKADLKWEQLVEIYKDHNDKFAKLETTAKFISDNLHQVKEVHSLKFRVKDPEHLIEKIIRKKLEDASLDIRLENYSETITDLIGVRALHLFKKDWIPIHQFITGNWELKETPTANIRKGDSDELTKQFTDFGCVIKEHPFGYRSVHYLVNSQPTKARVVAEVQVRTIFEEGWSEIDHRVRYPYNLDNVILSAFLSLFNRLAGSADEMGSFINLLKTELAARDEQYTATVNELTDKIKKLEIDGKKKEDLQSGVIRLSELSSAVSQAVKAMTVSPAFLESLKVAQASSAMWAQLTAQAAARSAVMGLVNKESSTEAPLTKQVKRIGPADTPVPAQESKQAGDEVAKSKPTDSAKGEQAAVTSGSSENRMKRRGKKSSRKS